MSNRNNSTNKYVLVAPFILMSLTSHLANADIFKWKDNHGVTQYSDSPPTSGSVKASRNEVVNALQKKDLCAEPVAKKLLSFTANENINFFNASFKGSAPTGFTTTTNKSNAQRTSKNNFFNLKSASAKNTNAAYNPTKHNAVFNFGNQKVSIFSASFKAKLNALLPAGLSPALVVNPVASSPAASSPATSSVAASSSGVAASTTSSPLLTNTVFVANSTPIVVAALSSSSSVPIPSSQPEPVTVALVTSSSSSSSTPTTSSTSSVIVQKELMPAVNITKNMAPVAGWTDLRIRPIMGSFDIPPVGDGDGQFRIDCTVSHMSNDDPLVYPNQQGAAHHHTFFGNTSINYRSNLATLSTTGNSTCRGGIANRSAYWVPSMIDSATSTPLKPYSSLWYYKTGYAIPKEKITAPPKGLRIVTGNMKATSAATSRNISYNCFKEGQPSAPATFYIPACGQGWTIVTHVGFPQCWDGRNLDSPDHISHMANPIGRSCPVSHPVAIPALGLNVKYLITDPEGTKNWRLSSDNYAKNGYNSGFSSHADWVNGWDTNVIAGVVKNCLNAGKDCGNHMLGDGTVIYAENVGVR